MIARRMLRSQMCPALLGSLILGASVFASAQPGTAATDLVIAAAKGDLASVNSLLSAKADVNATVENGLTALTTASINGTWM
ncbi:MAG: ankyrin repeat domain-containing protein [Terracidiphilus sp.]